MVIGVYGLLWARESEAWVIARNEDRLPVSWC